jgi:NitT/TauT family transport system substrate-binding protein
MIMVRHASRLLTAAFLTSVVAAIANPANAETVTIGIGTQDTTTNTATTGVIIR